MGWFSDALWGKKQRIDQNKINDYYAPVQEMLDKFKNLGEDYMDPSSGAYQSRLNMMRNNAYSQGNVNMQNIQKLTSMGNMNSGSAYANILGGNQELLGGVNQGFDKFMQQRETSGISLLDRYMRGQEGQADRQSNMHIQQVNAQNASRAANQQMGVSVLGMGLDFGAGFLIQGNS